MFMNQFLQAFSLDLQIEDASLDPQLSNSRRLLAALFLGTGPVEAHRAASRVSEVLMGLSQSRDALPALMMMLEDGGCDLERAIYFCQAGRGVGKALGDLDWILPMLAARVELFEEYSSKGFRARKVVRAFSRKEEGLRLKVDASRARFSSSLTYWGGKEAPVAELDMPLLGLTLDPQRHPLTRVLAGLCIGVGLDDAMLSGTELLEAMEEFWKDGTYVGGRLSAILANECDDFQRALFFATVGRARPMVKDAMMEVIEALQRRGGIWNEARDGQSGLQALSSPYVIVGLPEACVFDLGFVPANRDGFLHGQA